MYTYNWSQLKCFEALVPAFNQFEIGVALNNANYKIDATQQNTHFSVHGLTSS